MKFSDLLRRNLRHHWRTHLGVLLGTAVATAVLTGALLVGDSVRSSLERDGAARIGSADVALAAPGRFFEAGLADRIAGRLGADAAPVLRVDGVLVEPELRKRCNRVQVLGVDSRFWRLGGMADATPLSRRGLVVSENVAQRLGVGPGDEVLLRLRRTGPLSSEAPLSIDRNEPVATRLPIAAVLPVRSIGRYSLRAEQSVPHNAFVSLEWLAGRLDLDRRANEMLVGARGGRSVAADEADEAFRAEWTLADAGLSLRTIPEQGWIELRSDRIFLEDAVVAAAARAHRDAVGVLGYFVNSFRKGERSTPYSIVAALGALGAERSDEHDEIVVNQWLADDLGLAEQDPLEVRYFVLGKGRSLEERSHTFRVRSIAPMEGAALDSSLMPPFPGLEDRENCRDWDPGVDIDLGRIRDRDEDYWERFRGTPKAFLGLPDAQKLFANRFGSLTAVRYPQGDGAVRKIGRTIMDSLEPREVGLGFVPLRERARAAAEQALDFGQLFVGLSFFLIVSALVLTGLLFGLGMNARQAETGTLLALGFTWSRVRRLYLAEGLAVASAGAIAGAAGGVAYTALLLQGLSSVWAGAVAGATVDLHVTAPTLLIGAAAGIGAALLAIWIVLRRQARSAIAPLLRGAAGEEAGPARPGSIAHRTSAVVAIGCAVGALTLVIASGVRPDSTGAASFFIAGALLLSASISAIHWWLARAARSPAGADFMSLHGLALRNAARRRMRSLSVALLLALGTFLVFAVGANKLSPPESVASRTTGTGGFGLIGESTQAVLHDLNTPEGRREFGVREEESGGVSTVQIRIRRGDDASCLNLNRAQTPRLLGLDAAALHERGAFRFVDTIEGKEIEAPWLLLQRDLGGDTIPAVADRATLVWGLGKKIGDRIDFVDERGRSFAVQLVGMIDNSILQGSLLIDERAFTSRFPSEEGYRMLLVDVPPGSVDAVADALRRAGEEIGFDVTGTDERLRAFMTVQNTYLSIFQVLGSLGMILGSLGLGFLVLRNVFERQTELAMLRAVGLRRRTVCRLLVYEHGWLLALGLVFGTLSALVAVWPALGTDGADVPILSLSLTLVVLAAGGIVWIWGAAILALRRNLIAALRQE